MAIIFTDVSGSAENRGRVQVLDKPGTGLTPGSILHVPEWGGFSQFKAIFTNVTIAEQGNYQFLHTLGNHIYVYVFGDRIGQFGLSGLAFFDNCGSTAPNGRIGISHVIGYYRQLKLSVRAEPVLVTLEPDTVFRTFLLSMRGQVLNPATRIFQFHLGFALVPEDDESGGGGGSGSGGSGGTG